MVKYNETEKILLLSKYITSGMDARSFALSCGVPYTTFLNFCREYGNPDLSSIQELMKKENIPTTVEELQALLAKENIDGGLIGGAALKAETFAPIALCE